MQPVTVGLIGVGFFARTTHLPALALVHELRLLALATSREETARTAAERYRLPAYADYRDLLARPDIEAVIIATPADLHETISREALERGKHIFIESPGIPRIDGAHDVLNLARERRRVAQVGFLLRYSAPFGLVKTHLDAQPAPRPRDRRHAQYGGQYRRAAVRQRRHGGHHRAQPEQLEHRYRARANRHETFFAEVDGRRTVRIVAGMPRVAVEDWSLAASGGTSYAAQVFADRFLEASGAAAQLRAFARAIRQGIPPRSTLEDAIETQRLAQEITTRWT
jgi:predicted dehydrogenase